MRLIELIQLTEELWSADVQAKWTPPEGFFTKSANEIARGLKKYSKSYAQASHRLNFFINRAGKKLSGEDKVRLQNAKIVLKNLYKI